MKCIVMTGGGSAGHITPNLALIPFFQEEGYNIHYIGSENGIEHKLISKLEGVAFHPIASGKLRRYHSIKNLTDPFRVLLGFLQSWRHLHKIKPDIVFSKGGFVSVPVVLSAWVSRVPVICHESDMSPGLANRITMLFAKRIAVTFPECMEVIGKKAVLTGTAIRAALFSGSRTEGRNIMGLKNDDKPVLLVMGGSQGAKSINHALRCALPKLTEWIHIYHICGSNNTDEAYNDIPGYKQIEYADQALPDIMAATDIALSRAGSNSICELHALRIPMLLVPYPKGASRGDQIENAENFYRKGLCHIILQEDLSADKLSDALWQLYLSREAMVETMAKNGVLQGTQAILSLIHQYETV